MHVILVIIIQIKPFRSPWLLSPSFIFVAITMRIRLRMRVKVKPGLFCITTAKIEGRAKGEGGLEEEGKLTYINTMARCSWTEDEIFNSWAGPYCRGDELVIYFRFLTGEREACECRLGVICERKKVREREWCVCLRVVSTKLSPFLYILVSVTLGGREHILLFLLSFLNV